MKNLKRWKYLFNLRIFSRNGMWNDEEIVEFILDEEIHELGLSMDDLTDDILDNMATVKYQLKEERKNEY